MKKKEEYYPITSKSINDIEEELTTRFKIEKQEAKRLIELVKKRDKSHRFKSIENITEELIKIHYNTHFEVHFVVGNKLSSIKVNKANVIIIGLERNIEDLGIEDEVTDDYKKAAIFVMLSMVCIKLPQRHPNSKFWIEFEF